MNNNSIVVFGSCFLDYIAYGERIPNPGETLTSNHFQKGFGGKGANQAVAAARLLGKNNNKVTRVLMAGCVGSDGDGSDYIENLRNAGCDVSLMRRLENESTGIALIAVDKQGKNAIVICPNAAGRTGFNDNAKTSGHNQVFTPKDFGFDAKTSSSINNNNNKKNIFICQNEIPFQATLAALKCAHASGKFRTIFNPAPAPSAQQIEQLRAYLPYISLITPNEHEAFLMTGSTIKVTDLESATRAIKVLQELGATDVIITMGENGCVVAEKSMNREPVLVKPHVVAAVDTTGAGDCFVGSLAFFLASTTGSMPLTEACRRANVIAAYSVTKKGTQSSYHTRDQLPRELFADLGGSKL